MSAKNNEHVYNVFENTGLLFQPIILYELPNEGHWWDRAVQMALLLQNTEQFRFKQVFQSRITSSIFSTDEGLRGNQSILSKYTSLSQKTTPLMSKLGNYFEKITLLRTFTRWVDV